MTLNLKRINIKPEYIWLTIIVLLGGLIRFYKLGQVPHGFVNDEASIGYNAYSLLKTGKDEFGTVWPLAFRSFGDYKLPVYIYLTIPSILIFGLTEFAVRFPSAFFGVLTIPLVYFLVKKLIRPNQSKLWPLLSSLVLACLPWHIHFSRAAFEVNLALFFILLATYWFLQAKYLPSFFLFLTSIFTYHAPRVFVPLWLISLCLIKLKEIKPDLKKISLLFAITIVLPTFIILTSKQGLSRASGISIFHPQSGIILKINEKFRQSAGVPTLLVRAFHNKVESFSREILNNYFSHFDPRFLFFQGDPLRPRYRVPDVGQALHFSLPFFLIGTYFLIQSKQWLILAWLLLSPLSAAPTFETPSSVRAYLMIIPFCLAISLGLTKFISYIKRRQPIIKNFSLAVLFLIFIYNLGFYLNAYFIHAPVHEPYEWHGGYKELVTKVNQLQPQYQKIIMTDKHSTPYIFFLFYNQYDPLKWQQQVKEKIEPEDKFNFIGINKFDNIDFIGRSCPIHPVKDDFLYVCTANEHPGELLSPGAVKIIGSINYQNDAVAFVLMARDKSVPLPEEYGQ